MAPHHRPVRWARLIGAATGLIAAAFIIAWPVLRAIWWWLPELLLTAGLVVGWIQLAEHTDLSIRLVAVAVITGVPAAIPQVRRYIIAAGVVPDHPAPAPDLLLTNSSSPTAPAACR